MKASKNSSAVKKDYPFIALPIIDSSVFMELKKKKKCCKKYKKKGKPCKSCPNFLA